MPVDAATWSRSSGPVCVRGRSFSDCAFSTDTGNPQSHPYVCGMTKETRVLFNETCPICRFEVKGYRRLTEAGDTPVTYQGLAFATDWGLTPDQAARRFHVMSEGELLSGLPAFRALWQQMPRFRWLARVTALPVIAPVAGAVYDHILAPLLYRAHLRRQRRAAAKAPRDLGSGV